MLILHAGDMVSFSLDAGEQGAGGTAWLRTNLTGAAVKRKEIIESTESGTALLDRDWFDLPMKAQAPGLFSLSIPVYEPGIYEAKSFFLPDKGQHPVWPEGGNVTVKVEPACTRTSNSIYSAFVRLFGNGSDPVKNGAVDGNTISLLDKSGYTVIPKSGKFRDLIKQLDTIIGVMGFRNLLLLPIHPTPTTYARMGRFGSPFASLDFMDVDPALADFDRKTTPLDQFRELIDATHSRGASLFMDLPLNHTGWASSIQIHHPSWFARNHAHEFRSPGAWGVTWEDLAELNYQDRSLWQYMADVLLFWCRQGVDGFRCDAGYMVPARVWKYITAKVREQYPDTVFLLEGLGGKKEVTRQLLSDSNLNWAYSEIFQNYSRHEIEHHFHESEWLSARSGLLVNFAETHDNNRLASTSQTYARMRTSLCALLSRGGSLGITCGAEWFAEDKIVVHEKTSMNWGSENNQLSLIRTLNLITSYHPAFAHDSEIRMINAGHSNTVVFLRKAPGATAVAAVNLDCEHHSLAEWRCVEGINADSCVDIISGSRRPVAASDGTSSLLLAPGEAVCLSTAELQTPYSDERESILPSDSCTTQNAMALALEIAAESGQIPDSSDISPSGLADELTSDPEAFCNRFAGNGNSGHVSLWQWPMDLHRVMPLPKGSRILMRAPYRFCADLRCGDRAVQRKYALPCRDGWFTVLTKTSGLSGDASIELTLFGRDGASRASARILGLDPVRSDEKISLSRSADDVRRTDATALCTNGRGAMSLVRGSWGTVRSQYDALLSGNLHPAAPSDRHIMLTRCRAWLVLRGYSHEINLDCLESFTSAQPSVAEWKFSVPAGMGKKVLLRVCLAMAEGRNRINMHFERATAGAAEDSLETQTPVRIIIRYDIEDRSFHTKTKAFAGPENQWKDAVHAESSGFVFRPAHDRSLAVTALDAGYTHQPEWYYMVDHPAERERGLDGSSDLFSPGYFSAELTGGQSLLIHAEINSTIKPVHKPAPDSHPGYAPLSEVLKNALSQFVVSRDRYKTVIAGYPWFLDWGRDTLICLRGMIACGMLKESRDIICQFASFERKGTIPNMIRGDDVSNRDTSDAPLWLFAAVKDLGAHSRRGLLKSDCGGRPLLDILLSIAEHYIDGTPNGIKADPESGLIFSPSHFTWMDTNYPAGTPREGYPVEIQALWFNALDLLAGATKEKKWRELREKARQSISDLFYNEKLGCLSDCLHASPGTPASKAAADDHIRPNQLFAITLGAVEDRATGSSILAKCQQLLIPGAIRSLADRPTEYRLPILNGSMLLNDPGNPYWGSYSGDEDTRRKPAYHNGTAWTWPFPSFCEAMLRIHGTSCVDTALSYLSGMCYLMQLNCIGQIPEILDGNSPHAEKGCTAQAWGISEFARVLALLERMK